MDLARMLSQARFYGAKSEPIDDVEIIREVPLPDAARLLILRVAHGGRHSLYQVLVDAAGHDVLATSPELYLQAVEGGVGRRHGENLPTGVAKAIEGEQSNTSLIVGDRMLKVFRHLEAGLNPDVELLSRIPDCPNVAPVRGWVTAEIDGTDHTLAMVQDFVPEADDGWRFALGFSTLDASFAAEASLLGEATRAVHEALAGALPTEGVGADELGARLTQQLDDLVGRAPVLADFADDARAVYAALAGEDIHVQRIHGDLHLGQVLRTPDSYVLIDFEGEPARPLAERRLPDSPLRDVAGIIRSLDYAAHFPAHSGGAGPEDPAAWVQSATDAFLEGYGVGPGPLLDAYVLDKALYEVVYESDNRPDWVDIPLAAVRRILERQ
ncbi:maltokinase N-terminal cap-like domain-containing protein [Corynebacterium comes]|uniref:Maltokinase n=1 Tax=Corynebacterium comes TaxID=2675218 RepID=A0A6B8VZR7_9CORY|nr:hypothetical protein [Corynebacterium comes]QGU05217.1 Maltokinase [Corynebacterium comes]